MLASMRARGVGGAIIVLGAFAGVLPFVGPLFGFGYTSDAEAWTVTQDRIVLSVIPGAVAVLGGLLLQGRRVSIQRTGALLGLAGGSWFVLGPIFRGLWEEGERAASGGGEWLVLAKELAYHYGTGLALAALAGFALGLLAVYRIARHREEEITATEPMTRERVRV